MPVYEQYDTQELISSFHRGEHAALHRVYSLYLRPLCYFTEQLVSNTMAAEDIVSECFIQAFQKKADFPTLSQLKAFLYTSAKNAAFNYLKAKKRHDNIHQSIGEATTAFSAGSEDAYIKAEAMRAIFQEIEKLPPQCRQVVVLSVVEGKRAQEIAEELNIAYQTVLNQKAKGVNLLRVALLKNQLLSVAAVAYALSLLQK